MFIEGANLEMLLGASIMYLPNIKHYGGYACEYRKTEMF
jgi:hypothetical protein